jgi:predicted nucleic acid-binding protein
MNNLLVDTNIIIDLLSKREPFYNFAAILFSLADKKLVKLNLSSLSFANTHYILTREIPENETREVLRKFKILVNVLALDDKIIDLSLNSNFKDFEDAIQYYSAIENNLDGIITRNRKDFRKSKIPVLTPEEYIKIHHK